MKKFALYGLTAMMSFAFIACDNYEEPNPPAQSNPQQAIFEANGLAFTSAQATYNLDLINSEGENAVLGTVALTDFPEDYTLELVLELSSDNSFSKVATAQTTVENDAVLISPDALQGAYSAAVTKDPKQGSAFGRFAAYAVKDKMKARLGGENDYYGPFEITIIPLTPSQVIEEAYYLAYSNDGETWSADNCIKMGHSTSSQYDDPIFSLATTFTEEMVGDGMYWKIVPQSTVTAGDFSALTYGTSEEEVYNEEGALVANSEYAGINFITGAVLFTVNMEALTYNYFQAIENFWTPGNSNGWGFGSNCQTLFTDDYENYYGFIYLNGDFKFSPNPAWDGDFGSDDGITWELNEEGNFYVGKGKAEGSANIQLPAGNPAAIYYVQLNYPTRDLKLTQINTVGVIGGFNGWSASLALTPDATFTTWTGEVEMSAGDEWKFRMNDGWDINLGGDLNNLVGGGDNIKCEESGTYVVTLDLFQVPYTATVVKK
ncbi:MAG: hypothetical protein K2M07_06075 [Muribaculaceae bacterium]|nr:hypothetical protein [Muribaculaceae bacterium]